MPELLTLSRLARRLGVSQVWLRAEANNGRIPCLFAGRRLLFDLATVEEALRERAARGGDPRE
jgi:excisionase family DNA binding protein